MRVVAKLALAFFSISFLALLGNGVISARRDAHDVERSVASDVLSVGKLLRASTVSTWAAGDEDAVARRLASTSGAGDVTLAVTRLDVPPNDVVDVLHEEARTVVRARLPVVGDGQSAFALVVERALPPRAATFRAALADELALALVVALCSVALVGTLGGVLVGRPLERVVMQARRIGGGDLSQRLDADRNDEIGDLKREVNAMCERLAVTQKRLDDEATARLSNLEQLRHLDRLRTVGTLASGIAHELGTPLNVLLLRGQSLARGELSSDELGAAGRTIVGQVEKMSRIVRQLLDFARRERPTRARVQLESIAHRSLDLLSSLARRAGVEAAVEVDSPVSVEADAGQLEQAVTNLVMNAIQAMPSGGRLTLRVGVRPDTDTPGGMRPLDAAYLAVEDTGTGMDAETLRHVFEPFYTTKPAGQGTGLGLGVACGIAEDHGGFVEATSTPGSGSTFTLTLPRAR